MHGALDLFRLDGKVAVVTGGSKGIGMFYSQALAEAGASVVVADIDSASVAQTAERLAKEHDGRILAADLDVTSQDSIRAMVHQIDQRWGRLDILVNNARCSPLCHDVSRPGTFPTRSSMRSWL